MRRFAAIIVYGAVLIASGFAAWHGGRGLIAIASAQTIGVCLLTAYAALYLGELKQESIAQLYQALASSSLKSAEQAAFNENALSKVRQIRRIFLCSNILKLLGSMGALYLWHEKAPAAIPPSALTAMIVICASLFLFFLSILLFVRLWLEVSHAEELFLGVKLASLRAERKRNFVAENTGAAAHDFDADEAAKSYAAPVSRARLKEA